MLLRAVGGGFDCRAAVKILPQEATAQRATSADRLAAQHAHGSGQASDHEAGDIADPKSSVADGSNSAMLAEMAKEQDREMYGVDQGGNGKDGEADPMLIGCERDLASDRGPPPACRNFARWRRQ